MPPPFVGSPALARAKLRATRERSRVSRPVLRTPPPLLATLLRGRRLLNAARDAKAAVHRTDQGGLRALELDLARPRHDALPLLHAPRGQLAELLLRKPGRGAVGAARWNVSAVHCTSDSTLTPLD